MSPLVVAKKKRGFDSDTFLATIGDGRKILSVPKKQPIFAQGDACGRCLLYSERAKSGSPSYRKAGKEATIGDRE